MVEKNGHSYEFETFRLDGQNPGLWRGDALVPVPPKVLETLLLLVEKRGDIVSREELLEKVWKKTFVEEGNINYTISLLRKTLGGKNMIQTVPRRGYRFMPPVKEISSNGDEIPHPREIVLPIKPLKKRPFRWVLFSILAAGFLILTGLAFWRPSDKTGPPSSTSSTQKVEAMQAYTRGKLILEKRGAEDREQRAIDEFQNAARLDPTFAPAYAGIAEVYSAMAVKSPHPKSAEFYAKAKSSVERSLVLDENLAEGWLIRGWLKRQADWDWAGAEHDLRRAIELNPQNPTAHRRLGQLLSSLGKLDEALAEVNTAYQLDPVADYVVGARFPVLEARREYDQALKESEEFYRENKANSSAVRAYGTFLYHTGNFQKTIELGEEAIAKNPSPNAFAWLSLLSASYHRTGQPDKADAALRELEKLAQTETKALYSLALNYAELGRTDEAISVLRKCVELHEERIVWIKVEPRFANLRNNEGFQEIIKKIYPE